MDFKHLSLLIETAVAVPPDRAWAGVLSPSDLIRVSFPLLSMSFEGEVPERWERGPVYRVNVRQFSLLPPRLFEIKFSEIDPEKRKYVAEERGGEFESWRHTLEIRPSENGGSVVCDRIDIVARSLPFAAVSFIRLLYRTRRRRLR